MDILHAGAVLTGTDMTKRTFPKQTDKSTGRFPPVVVLAEELAELQHVTPPGQYLALLARVSQDLTMPVFVVQMCRSACH